ncbi:hypothetical protein KL929_003529 [Ogataea haglerorum]|nr:hypothetical protein KL929_003529 [Ogataea haglerorum]KAG7800246.1 hypothetical protein KL944_003819 [Ogataea haglerorum]
MVAVECPGKPSFAFPALFRDDLLKSEFWGGFRASSMWWADFDMYQCNLNLLFSNSFSQAPILPMHTIWINLLVAVAACRSVLAMDMEAHGHTTSTLSAPLDLSTVVPVAHEAHHMHGVPILETELTPAERLFWEAYNTTSYFTVDTPYKSQLYVHLGLVYAAYVLVYPLVLVLRNVNSKWFLPLLTVQSAMVIASLFCYSLFISNAPELYPNNAYSKMSTGLFLLVIIHLFSSFVYTAKKWLEGPSPATHAPLPGKDIPMSELNGFASPSSTLYESDDRLQRLSADSFDLEDQGSSTLNSQHSVAAPTQKRDFVLARLFQLGPVAKLVSVFGLASTFNFHVLNYGMLAYFLVYAPTGVAVLSCIGMGNHVFNLLAHFIKGGVFFTLGIISLARYCGAWTKLGWAWNKSYILPLEKRTSLLYRLQPKNSMITMEMVESSLILFYGCTNVFLEHLAAPGGPWTAKDLQHVSIAFLFIGAGLCGVVAELKLADWRLEKFYSQVGSDFQVQSYRPAHVTPGFSPNPFPAFTIFWTGLLMSQHQQASQLSMIIHVQWGSLLTYGSVVRLVTFLLMTFFPKSQSFQPSRPFTELLTSFCLLCGGLVFMESTDPVVMALEYRGWTPMFTMNLSVGTVSLLMAWVMCVFSIRDRLKTGSH